MRQRTWVTATALGILAATVFLCVRRVSPAQARADSTACASCHADIWNTYRKTGMAQSFFRPAAGNIVEDYTNSTYYHKASDTYFAMVRRGDQFFQQQFQIGFDGKRVNLTEKKVDYILGSGNHARSYLSLTPSNTLILMPLGWYSENGGQWGMNPGYDRADHQGFGRTIGYRCMFCHNSYPEIPAENNDSRSVPVYTSVPEGIDCQRCHGDGTRHIALARSAVARPEDIRRAIVNPSRLAPERQMEVCMQCHLTSTSFPLPGSIERYEREPFSYQPDQPLADFVLNFDHAAGRGYDDGFDITSAAYRLRESQCFEKSAGALQCTTCHDPHKVLHGDEAARHYTQVCRQCHAAEIDRQVSAGQHPASTDCVGCHMPKRRTQDVVHVVMTDHDIQRQKPARDLLAPMEESEAAPKAYRGPVVPYYPGSLSRPDDELYLAIAQVIESSNLAEGVPRLAAAIEKYQPANAEYYLQLGDALRKAGQAEQAIPVYEEAVRREPRNAAARERLAAALMEMKQYARSEQVFMQALVLEPNPAADWVQIGLARFLQNRTTDAMTAFETAIALNPDMPVAYNSIGTIWLQAGNAARAETALRNAIRIEPNYAQAHNNLANLLSAAGKFDEAQYHFLKALRYSDDSFGASNDSFGASDDSFEAHVDYALALVKARHLDEAQNQAETALRINPSSPEAHDLMGNLLGLHGQREQEIAQFREAVRLAPDFNRANLDLAEALVDAGDADAAIPYLRKAAQGSDTRQESLKILQKLGKAP
jgi:tetratricopeptide (TPR) repeat protein